MSVLPVILSKYFTILRHCGYLLKVFLSVSTVVWSKITPLFISGIPLLTARYFILRLARITKFVRLPVSLISRVKSMYIKIFKELLPKTTLVFIFNNIHILLQQIRGRIIVVKTHCKTPILTPIRLPFIYTGPFKLWICQ